MNTHFTFNGKTHITAKLYDTAQARSLLSDSDHWNGGAIVTACRKALPLSVGQLDGPGVVVETTCGNCKRTVLGKEER